ncbi:30S ribosomal protein S11 [Patescibacteria group bacterium]|nr:30S ribosomal protein S11 [Patescibacteria group bacterium]
MGKKRVIETTEKELLEERDKVEQKLKKEISVKGSQEGLEGRIYIYSTYNNTIITLTDKQGNVLVWRTAGSIGFKGAKKGTSYAGSKVAEAITAACYQFKIKKVDVFIKGIGGGRAIALKTLANQGLTIQSIEDVTPIPHNGCRPRKPRRV